MRRNPSVKVHSASSVRGILAGYLREEMRVLVLRERIRDLRAENLERRRENIRLRLTSAGIMLRVRKEYARQLRMRERVTKY